VNGAVVVLLGRGDVVVELAGQVLPLGVHHPQGGIAFGNGVHVDAHGAHVVDLVEGLALALHLLPDPVDVLGPAMHLGMDADRIQLLLQVGFR